jgi:acetylornithine/succinyldiaminopimelate/putrescine aminotransferase
MMAPPDTTFPIAETFGQMIDRQLPNLFRLYLNPIVVQACVCLSRIAEESRCESTDRESFHLFLANGHDEALSGAIKLARYIQNLRGSDTRALVRGPRDRIAHFASTTLPSGRRIQFLPDVVERFDEDKESATAVDPDGFGITLSFASSNSQSDRHNEDQLTILSVAPGNVFDSGGALRRGWSPIASPDIVVFDESWVHRKVPFSAFAARSSLFRHWRKKHTAMFHSTTFQPNTVASLQLLNCLRRDAPAFMKSMRPLLERVEHDRGYRSRAFNSLYSPSLARLIRTTGFDQSEPITEGHNIRIENKTVFDAVGGVACSIRGHNPPSYLQEVTAVDASDLPGQLNSHLQRLIGLGHCTPAGSGASAVEAALKIGLATQTRGDFVLALRGGFGGKTLLALTGTDNDRLKENLQPLYPRVIFVDPYAADSIDALRYAMDRYRIGVVQMELVQGVGGVRAVPRSVIDYVQERRQSDDYWLFVDEVQTGMYRTGEITLSKRIGVSADILTLGKGTSDMMFPSALTLHSEEVERRLREMDTDLDSVLKKRHEYEWGYKTILNTLQFCERRGVREKVVAAERLFRERLHGEVDRLANVREIRVFGLLIGIELQARGALARLGSSLASLYLLEMLHHPRFPVLAGFCQNERNVLKLTPPLTVNSDEIVDICDTVTDALSRPLSRLAMSGASAKLRCHLPSHRLTARGKPSHNVSAATKSRAHESAI